MTEQTTHPAPASASSAVAPEDLLVPSGMRNEWLVANTIAFTIAGGLGGGVLRAIIGPYFNTDVSAWEQGAIQAAGSAAGGAIFGLIVGAAQWLVLRRAIRAAWWAPATALGFVLAGALGGLISGGSTSNIGPKEGPLPLLVSLLLLPVILASVSFFQWLILRTQADEAAPWLLINLAGLFVGGMVGLFVSKLFFGLAEPLLGFTGWPSARALLVVGLVSGPVYAALTWAFLSQLPRRGAARGATT
jgi:hypothetical protein